jgi:hypothetical protein
MKRFIFLLGLTSIAALGAADILKIFPPAKAASLEITSKSILLNRENPDLVRVGELIYRGGLNLKSTNKDFGGISGMRLWNEDTVLAVSDAGSWISFKLIEKKGQLIGVKGIALAPILDSRGLSGSKKERDAEAVIIDKNIDQVSVTFEGEHRIWMYDGVNPLNLDSYTAKVSTDWRRPWMMFWPINGGAEATCTVGAAGTLLISEESEKSDGIKEAYVASDKQDMPLGFQSDFGFKPTDCIMIDGTQQALVLQRRFSPMTGVAASIGVIDLSNITANKILIPREIARLESPFTVDNMEGIFVTKQKSGTFIYIVSDDNFSGLQRTILMKFEWVGSSK